MNIPFIVFILLMALNAFIGLRVCTVIDGLGPDKTMEQFSADVKRAFGYIMLMLAAVETLILGGVIVLTNHGIM